MLLASSGAVLVLAAVAGVSIASPIAMPLYRATPLPLPRPITDDYSALTNDGFAAFTVYPPVEVQGLYAQGLVVNTRTGTSSLVAPIPGAVRAYLRDINESGTAVGTTVPMSSAGTAGPTVYRNGVAEILPEHRVGSGMAFAINDAGVIVGRTRDVRTGMLKPAIWTEQSSGWSLSVLSTPTSRSGMAFDVNNAGVVVGLAETSTTEVRPVVWREARLEILPSLGGNFAQAVRINDAGQVVCMATDVTDEMRAYVWSDGHVTEIGTDLPGRIDVFDMNNAGDCVGSIAGRAFLYRNGVTMDLNQVVDNLDGGHFYRASAINDYGEIIAMGSSIGGFSGVFALTPVQVPGGTSIALFVVLASARRHRYCGSSQANRLFNWSRPS